MKDKDLEFIASRNLDFKKLEKYLINMWLKPTIMPYFKLPTKKKYEMKYKPSKEQLKEVYEILAIESEKCLELSKQLGIYFKRLSDEGRQANKAGIFMRNVFLLLIKHGKLSIKHFKSFEEAIKGLKNLSKKAPK